jgi:hypothetical protein
MFRLQRLPEATVKWWRRYAAARTDLAPPYQRKGGQWSVYQKSYLIDSILNEYDIPKFYFADFSRGSDSLNVTGKEFALIDGRQRLEAIQEFLDDDLALDEAFVLRDDPSLDLRGYRYTDLEREFPLLVERFNDFSLDVVLVVTNDEARINDLFIRLNSGTGLTGAQVRNAMQGTVPAVIREIASHVFFDSKVAFSKRRGEDLNVAAKILLLEFRGALQDTKRVHLDRFVTGLAPLAQDLTRAEAGSEDVERAANRAGEVLSLLASHFHDRDPLLRTQGPVSVYYWLVRTRGSDIPPDFRNLLERFHNERKMNRWLVRAQGEESREVDTELLAFDSYSRNANDARSIEGMVQILQRRVIDVAEVRR